MNKLKGSSVYLTGSIDHSEDPRKWRRDIANNLLLPLDIKVYDPLIKPGWLGDLGGCHPSTYNDAITSAVKDGYADSVESHIFNDGIKKVRDIDLRFAHDCNFMICHLPKKPTFGTLEELKVATDAGKPILFHMPDGVVSTWIPAQVASTLDEYVSHCHFGTWDELYDYVIAVDSGKLDVDKFKWIFISYYEDPDVISELGI